MRICSSRRGRLCLPARRPSAGVRTGVPFPRPLSQNGRQSRFGMNELYDRATAGLVKATRLRPLADRHQLGPDSTDFDVLPAAQPGRSIPLVDDAEQPLFQCTCLGSRREDWRHDETGDPYIRCHMRLESE